MTWDLTIFINGWVPNDFASVLYKLLAELFCNLMCLAFRCITLIDIVLHIHQQVRIGMVEESDALSDDFTVHSGEVTEDNVVVHDESILANPVPGRVKAMGPPA